MLVEKRKEKIYITSDGDIIPLEENQSSPCLTVITIFIICLVWYLNGL
jgi:hypothetical protein